MKYKMVYHSLSHKSVVEFEPHIHLYINSFLKQWDRLYDGALHGGSGPEGEGWRGENGTSGWTAFPVRTCPSHLSYFCLISPGISYLAFDIIGDLAFGAPLGLINAARNTAQVPKNKSSPSRSQPSRSSTAVVSDTAP